MTGASRITTILATGAALGLFAVAGAAPASPIRDVQVVSSSTGATVSATMLLPGGARDCTIDYKVVVGTSSGRALALAGPTPVRTGPCAAGSQAVRISAYVPVRLVVGGHYYLAVVRASTPVRSGVRLSHFAGRALSPSA